MSIMKQDIYIKLDNHVRTGHKEICLKDVASVYCGDGNLKTRAEQVVIFSFDGEEKEVISILYIYEKLYEAVGEDIQIHSIGESDCVIDLTDGKTAAETLVENSGCFCESGHVFRRGLFDYDL